MSDSKLLIAEKVALYEKIKNLQKLEDGHQKLNGELRLEIANLKEEKEKILKDQDIKNDQHTCDKISIYVIIIKQLISNKKLLKINLFPYKQYIKTEMFTIFTFQIFPFRNSTLSLNYR